MKDWEKGRANEVKDVEWGSNMGHALKLFGPVTRQ